MKFNTQVILDMVKSDTINDTLTYEAFDRLFPMLPRREQYTVADILAENGITLRDADDDMAQAFASELAVEDDVQPAFLTDGNVFGSNDPADFHFTLRSNSNLSNELLAKAAQEGNEEAKNELFLKNKRLVTKHAAQYVGINGNTLNMKELESAGNFGLLKAMERFDVSRGYYFSTYAVWWIRQSIFRDIQDNGYTVHIPVHMREKIRRVMRAESDLIRRGKMTGDRIAAIVEALKDTNQPLTEKQVVECLRLRKNVMHCKSLDMPVGEDEEAFLGDFVPADPHSNPEYQLEQMAMKSDLAELLNTLTPREREVLTLRYGLDGNGNRTLEEVGKDFGVTRERIRQIEAKALRKLRYPAKKANLEIYLEEIA